MNTKPINLKIKNEDFQKAFQKTKKFLKAKDEAILSFDGLHCKVITNIIAITIKATGNWPIAVKFPAIWLTTIAKFPMSQETIEITVESDRLYIGTQSISCKIQKAGAKLFQLPLNATASEILNLKNEYTKEQIEAAGYTKLFENTISITNNKIEKATKLLMYLGITKEKLNDFVYETLKQQSKQNTKTSI